MATFEELIAKSRELHAAGDTAGAKRVAEIALKQRGAIVNRKGLTGAMGLIEQGGAGLNEGFASALGAPVDLAASLITRQRPQFTDTTDYANFDGNVTAAPDGMTPGIEAPIMGSGTMMDVMDPVISDRQPASLGERFARRTGQEVGFGTTTALAGAAIPGFGAPARANIPAYMATSAAGDVGAAIGGQAAQELAPGNQTLDFLASLLGGAGGAYGASRLTPETVPVQSLDELKQGSADKWATIKGSTDTLTPSATARLSPELYAMLQKNRATNPNLFPRANETVKDITALPPKSLYEVEEARRLAGRNVAADANEASVGVQMKKTIDEYLSGLGPNDVVGADPDAAIALMRDARNGSHQAFKADEILNKEMRGETRAATTGTGGNEVNATKQNIRTIFDRERDPTLRAKSGGYTPDEMAAMEGVIFGDTKSNIARMLGRMAPTSGALPMMATGWGGAAGLASGVATGNPMMAIPALAGGVGFAAKAAAEGMTKKQIERLMKTILNGGRAPAMSTGRAAANRAVIEQLLSGAASGQPQ